MQSVDGEKRRQAWSSYWASGALHSCVGSYKDNYDGVIGNFWLECFGQLMPGARVLDLAAGNGALSRMLWEMVAGRWPVSIDAIDLAEVAPPWLQAEHHSGIAFHPGICMEKLPFPDGSFDLVVSQFGLEYAQWPRALEEVVRVCREQGRLAFVVHHADSLIVRMAESELRQQQILLTEDGLLAAARDVLPWLMRAHVEDVLSTNTEAHNARSRYNQAMTRVGRLIEESTQNWLLIEVRESVHAIVSGRLDAEATKRSNRLNEFRNLLEDAVVRTEELLRCALDERRALQLTEMLRQRIPSQKVNMRSLAQAEGLLGWGFTVS